jgi:hypothetical protein
VDRVLAIVGLRARTLFRRYRSASDLARLAGSALSLLLAGGLAIGLAIGFGVMTHMLARGRDESMMRLGFMVTFYSFLFFGAILPLVMGVSNQGFDVAPFRLFPIGRPKLYSITLAAYAASPEQLLYYPALVTVTLTGVVFAGVNIPIGLTLIGLLLLFYVAWGNAALLFLAGIMRRRRIREVLVMIAFMFLIAASLVPSLIIDPATDSIDQSGPVVGLLTRLAVGLGKFLPPGLAAQGLTGLYISGVGAALPGLLLLAFWDLAGIALGYGAFLRYHLGAPESAASPSRAIRADTQRSARRRLFSADSPLLTFVPSETRAVAAKEMRYLLRSVVGKFNLITALRDHRRLLLRPRCHVILSRPFRGQLAAVRLASVCDVVFQQLREQCVRVGGRRCSDLLLGPVAPGTRSGRQEPRRMGLQHASAAHRHRGLVDPEAASRFGHSFQRRPALRFRGALLHDGGQRGLRPVSRPSRHLVDHQ